LGIHQDQNVRENAMKAELKLLMSNIIAEVVENWQIINKMDDNEKKGSLIS